MRKRMMASVILMLICVVAIILYLIQFNKPELKIFIDGYEKSVLSHNYDFDKLSRKIDEVIEESELIYDGDVEEGEVEFLKSGNAVEALYPYRTIKGIKMSGENVLSGIVNYDRVLLLLDENFKVKRVLIGNEIYSKSYIEMEPSDLGGLLYE